MVFSPYTIDIGSAATSYTVVGLNPSKQYSFQVAGKNSIGTGTISNAVTTTMAAQVGSNIPSIVQSNTFRSDNPASATITLSLMSVPNAANTILVFFNGFAGTGSNSNAITAPTGAVVLSGPNYDSASEVTWCWQITQNITSNGFTFSNFDNTDNAGWKIVEIANFVSYDVNHGPITAATATSITWPLVAPTNTNCIRLSLLSIQFADTIGTPGAGITNVKSDPVTVAYHQGVLLSETASTSSGSLTVSGGTVADTDTYLSINIYGSSLPAQVSGLTAANITASSVKLSWTAVTGATSYTVMYEGGGISSFTQFGLPLASTSTTVTLTGLIASTTYSFEVFASNSSGQGPVSSIVTIATLAVQALSVVQSASITKVTAGATTGTLTATFATAPTVGNTLAFFYTGFNDTNNAALAPPGTAANSTGILTDDGSGADPLCMFWTQQVVASTTNYSFGVVDDEASLIVVELLGVTSVATPAHGGSLTAVDGASGHVVVPVAAPPSTPALTLVMLNMTNTVDSWGVAPSNMSLINGVTGNSSVSPTYHSGAVFSATSAVSGNQTIPYALAVGTQVAAPTYISVAFLGSAGVIPPGQVVVTAGATTSSTQVLNWGLPTGSPSSYTIQYRVTGQTTWVTASTSVTALTYTVSSLTSATSYQYQVIAYVGTTAGPSSAVISATTLASSPGQVTGVTLGTVTSTTQQVSWTAPSGTITTYTLQYKLATAGTYTAITGLTGTNTVVTGLVPASSYNYTVFALNGTNAGPVSAVVTGSTSALPAPGQPTNVTLGAVTSTTQVISWTASTGTVTQYNVLYSTTSSSGPWTTLNGITSTSTTVTGLIPSTVVYYEVIAYNGSTPSAASVVVNGTTSGATPPGQVVGLAVGTTTSTSQVLNWSIPTGTVTSYTLQYKITGASSFISITGIVPNTYTLTGLAPATNYTYQVIGYNTTVAGSASSTITNTTLTSAGTQGSSLVTIGGKLLVVGGKMVIA